MTGAIVFGGHSTVVVEVGAVRLVTDPLLRRGVLGLLRRHEGMEPQELGAVDAVLISHLHHDHLDLPSLRKLGTSTPIVGPRGSGTFLGRRGFADVTELSPGETTTIGPVSVRAVEARHEGGRIFGVGSSETVGYVVEGEARIYFAGDTDLFPGMSGIGPNLDVALLPIWGWGPKLGPGHLDPHTAAEAAAMLGPRAVVPIHWGSVGPPAARTLWPWLFTRPGAQFTEAMARTAPQVAVHVLRAGERLELEDVRQ